MEKKAMIFNSIALPILLAVDILYMIFSGLWLKGVTSSIFVIIGIVNLILVSREGKTLGGYFKYLMCTGLFVCFVADILLNIWFIIGAIVFAVGHVFYFVAYLQLSKFSLKDIICGLCIVVPSILVLILYPFDYQGLFPVIIVYAIIISFMVGKAISNAIFGNGSLISRLLIVIGSALFFISDLALLFSIFGGGGVPADNVCLLTYYPAQGILALAIYFACKNTETKNVEESK